MDIVLKKQRGESEETHKENSNSELFKTKEVKNTPFSIVIDKEKKECFGICGNYAVTKPRSEDNIKELEKELKKVTWNKIIQVLGIMQANNNLKNLEKNG